MRWSLRLGSLFGIPVYLHMTFLLLLGFLGLAQLFTSGIGAAVAGTVTVLAVFGCVLLHEFGHALAARRYGIRTRDVTLLPIGGLARLERMPDDPRQELWVALAGPAVNVVIAATLALWIVVTGFAPGPEGLSLTGGSLAGRLLAINVGLVLFNMLPAFPMDGGRVLRSLLAHRLSYLHATEIAATVGKGMAVLFGVAGLFWNPMLIFIAFFVWFGAGQEAAMARHRFQPAWTYGPQGAWTSGSPDTRTYGAPRQNPGSRYGSFYQGGGGVRGTSDDWGTTGDRGAASGAHGGQASGRNRDVSRVVWRITRGFRV